MAVSAASAMSLKRRSISSLDLAADARAPRARRSAQPSNKEGLEDPTLETPLKDTGLPPSPPAPPIDGRTLFNLETLLIATKMKAEAEAQEAQNMTTMKTEAEALPDLHVQGVGTMMKAEAEVSPEGLADKTTTDKTSPILNDLGPVALPRIGKKERFSKPCPRHRQAGHRAGPHQYCSKPFNCGCCMGTCHLCEPAKNLWSPSTRLQSMMAAKRAEQMKQYNRVLSINICCSLRCLLAQKAKRTEQMKQYNQQYKDAAEQAETSKLGPFGADPFGLTFGADPPESQPDFENSF